MTRAVHIGIDFDNTIAGYDHVFLDFARDKRLVPDDFTGSKTEVRDTIKRRENGEYEWQRMQGQVYGRLMGRAELIVGVSEFILKCRECRIPLSIISHKTEFAPFDSEVNLRNVAYDWMEDHGFFDVDGFAFKRENIYFETTRADKVARISTTRCSHFIDDLEQVFLHPSFPSSVEGYLFSRQAVRPSGVRATICQSWQEISDAILG